MKVKSLALALKIKSLLTTLGVVMPTYWVRHNKQRDQTGLNTGGWMLIGDSWTNTVAVDDRDGTPSSYAITTNVLFGD